jgi:DNA-binding response OmpR family regulator
MTQKRILVVDDEVAIQDVVKAYLQKEGFLVDTASSGREALEKVVQQGPDLIVLDLMLPDPVWGRGYKFGGIPDV